jgi:hypothetical protein
MQFGVKARSNLQKVALYNKREVVGRQIVQRVCRQRLRRNTPYPPHRQLHEVQMAIAAKSIRCDSPHSPTAPSANCGCGEMAKCIQCGM